MTNFSTLLFYSIGESVNTKYKRGFQRKNEKKKDKKMCAPNGDGGYIDSIFSGNRK